MKFAINISKLLETLSSFVIYSYEEVLPTHYLKFFMIAFSHEKQNASGFKVCRGKRFDNMSLR